MKTEQNQEANGSPYSGQESPWTQNQPQVEWEG